MNFKLDKVIEEKQINLFLVLSFLLFFYHSLYQKVL